MEPLSAAELRRLGAGIVAEAQHAMDVFNGGMAHQRRGDWQAARDAFTQVANMGVPYVSARAALNLGIVLEEQWHDLDGARRAYERAAASGRDTEVGPGASSFSAASIPAWATATRRSKPSGAPTNPACHRWCQRRCTRSVCSTRASMIVTEHEWRLKPRSRHRIRRSRQRPRKDCVAWPDEADNMSQVEPRTEASESWWAAYERDFAPEWSDEPFRAIFATIEAQSAAVYGPAWPGCSLAVSRLDGHPATRAPTSTACGRPPAWAPRARWSS